MTGIGVPHAPTSFPVTHAGVLRLAVPMTLAYLSTPLVGVVDTAVVGRLGQAALIGGIAVAALLFDVVFTTFNFLRGATTGLTAQAMGAGNAREEAAVLARALAVALSAGLLVVLLQGPMAALGFALLGVEGGVLDAARTYFHVRVWSAPFALGNYAVLGWVLGRGQAGAGLALQTLLNGVNVALASFFVLCLGWGVAGAAAATVIAEAVTFAAGLALVARRLDRSALPARAEILDPARFRRMMAVNGDIMVRSFSLLFAFALFTRLSAAQGEVLLAANAVLMHFFLLGGYFLDGFAAAAEQLAGRAVGARDRSAFEGAVRLTFVWTLALAALVTLVCFALGPALVDLMTTAPDVRAAARDFLPFAALTPLAGAVAFQMDGVFIGATWSRDMRNLMLASVALYLAALAVLAPAFGNAGLWASLLVFLGARSTLFPWRMRRLLPRTFAA